MKALVICRFTFFREALCSALCQVDDSPVIIEAVDVAHAGRLLQAAEATPDLVLASYDVLLDGVEAIAPIKAQLPEVPVVVFGQFSTDADVRQAVAAGASGCISPSDGWKKVCDTVKRVLAGEIVLTRPCEQQAMAQSAAAPQADEFADIKLTPRQVEVLELIRRGKSNKEIARNLQVAEGTVKMHCVAIFRELSVTNRTQAAVVGDHLAATRAAPMFSAT